jgi:Phosphodiesterase/alkaline phosphatase D
MPSSRRAFLKTFLSGTGCFAAAAAFPFAPSEPARPNGDADVHFPQGVASGDPTPDSILLWTRVQRADAPTEHPLPLVVQVSRRHDFSTVLAERALTVTAASDHTARVFVHDLPSDSVLFYRFLAGDGAAASRRGRTRTAPSPDADRPVRFAYASCQAYEAGYYGVYRTLISEDKEAPPEEKLDFVLHLGDFIYEGLGYGDARSVPPFPSGGQHGEGTPHAKTANDYRHLYRRTFPILTCRPPGRGGHSCTSGTITNLPTTPGRVQPRTIPGPTRRSPARWPPIALGSSTFPPASPIMKAMREERPTPKTFALPR